MSKINILLVDDHPGKLLTYQAILAELGENLVLARSGREALQCLLKDECALILLDVVMPEMDGFEIAAMIRERPRLKRTPIIFVTAYSPSEMDKLRAYEMGAVDFVFAPIVPEILRAKVSALVELDKSRRELARINEQLRTEIAERKRAEEHALQSERLAAIGEMVTGLAHESRNALQQIQASVEMLARRIKSRDEVSFVVEIQRAHDRIQDLLNAVRSYAAPLNLKRELRDLSRLWNEAWDQLATQRQGRDVEFCEEPGDLDPRCLVDPLLVQRLFRNVLENSLSACRDPVKIRIQCSAGEIDGQAAVRIRIVDNGSGLTDEQKRRIFDPFYTTKTSGTGLGMAIAQRIAVAHGGQIAVGDESNQGTAIEILLPRGQS